MKINRKLLSVFGFVALATTAIFADDPRKVIVVPSPEAPTIQLAFDSGADLIILQPGYYQENIVAVIDRNVTIRSVVPLAAAIDGGTARSTFSFTSATQHGNIITLPTSWEWKVTLQGLVIINQQKLRWYSSAAVFVEFNPAVIMQDCWIYHSAIGLSTNYTVATIVERTVFIGIGDQSEAIGVLLGSQDMYRPPDKGARIVDSIFWRLGVAIDRRCTYWWPRLSDDGPEEDSNHYRNVWLPITPRNVCQF